MRALTPWTGMTSFKNEVDRLSERFLEPAWTELPSFRDWQPKVDVSEGKDAVTVTRVMRLPAAVDGSKATASFKDGVVTVILPRAPGATGTTIPIKAA